MSGSSEYCYSTVQVLLLYTRTHPARLTCTVLLAVITNRHMITSDAVLMPVYPARLQCIASNATMQSCIIHQYRIHSALRAAVAAAFAAFAASVFFS